MEKNIDEIVSQYRNSCIQYGLASVANNSKQTNRAHDKIINYFLQLRELGRIDALEILIFDIDENVRAWAATHLLKVNEELAKKILTEIKSRSDLLGFDAEMTLIEWEKGSLTLDYDNYKVKW